MLQLRAHCADLTYSATLAPSLAALIDTPGKLASALISEFDHLDVSLSDVSLDEGPLEDRGLSCEVKSSTRVFCFEPIGLRVASIFMSVGAGHPMHGLPSEQ